MHGHWLFWRTGYWYCHKILLLCLEMPWYCGQSDLKNSGKFMPAVKPEANGWCYWTTHTRPTLVPSSTTKPTVKSSAKTHSRCYTKRHSAVPISYITAKTTLPPGAEKQSDNNSKDEGNERKMNLGFTALCIKKSKDQLLKTGCRGLLETLKQTTWVKHDYVIATMIHIQRAL